VKRKSKKRKYDSSDSSEDSYSSTSSRSSSSSSDSDDKRRKHKSKKKRKNKKASHKTVSKSKYIKDTGKATIGPVIPAGYKPVEGDTDVPEKGGFYGPQIPGTGDSDDDDGVAIGPSLGLQAKEGDISAAAEFEARTNRMMQNKDKKVCIKLRRAIISDEIYSSWMISTYSLLFPCEALTNI